MIQQVTGFFRTGALLSVFLSAAGTVLTTSPPVAAADDASITGRWKVSVTTDEGNKEYYLELKHEGDKVNGAVISPRTGTYPFEGGKFSKGVLRLEVERKREETTQKFVIEAKWQDGGRFAGKLVIDGNAAGDITIERAAAESPAPGKSPGKSPVAGKWNVVTKTADGNEYTSQLEINEIEKGIAGKSKSQLGEIDVKAISFEGKTLSFDLVLPINGNDVAFEIKAELKDADTLAGRWKTKEADFSGDWNAIREKPAAQPTATPAGASPLSGAWYGVTSQGQDKVNYRLVLEASGVHLTGKIHAHDMEFPILEGRADGNKFQFVIEVGDDKQKVKVEGTLEGELVKGRYVTPSGDGGEFSARRPARL
jgi:hypothetical protein